ncbi:MULTISPECIES: branched-chain amino acid ABC transporter ATP-binding protein/permease [unclassified Beijerinckia]|uniref:branched-chain amino acid ABC transporter ATP-binding protein/permease n=1 Tax=unclassified Beijerinckia TaxID=2638183 RepID=UPI000896324E|nr:MULTISPECIES: branched-chain amino acid ABC transporter ATP-binding protein/permease [unclassified Beijerinckia]MDH7798787.1 branched-chain amino acid transport system permease protein [Beijerinckia sp. GAS462]SED33204.1 amino acid/amide ABC transporter membrane protein 2, HAAT family /amino acid/amide ABC transporter ATP-binding protein 1, HAAT family [Beijerinckia sp. 28-YEA-48]
MASLTADTPVIQDRSFTARFGVPAALAVALLFFALLPAFGAPPFFESFLYLLFLWIALSTSWTILSGFTGYFSFGHGAFYGVGMYTTANLGTMLPIWLCLVIAAILAALLSLGIGAVVFRVRRLRGELFALLTLALTIVVATIVLNTPIDGGPGKYLLGVQLPRIYDNSATTIYLLGACVAIGTLATAYFVQYGRLGRGLFAIADDEDVAEGLGVPSYRYKLIAFAISSAIAGIAGAVHAIFVSYVTVSETFSSTVALFVILMSVIGGMRHWLGPAIGAVFVTTINFVFVSGDSALAARIVIGLALILATLFLPEGVAGLVQKRVHKWRAVKEPGNETVAPPVAPILPATAPARTTARPVLLKAENISLAFRGVQALDGVSFDIRQGEILGLVGPNGSGKSTLINVMNGFYKPDTGSLLLEGHDLAQLPAHRIARLGLARTFQIPRPFPHLSVLDNVMVAAMFGGAAYAQETARRKALETLDFVGLASRAGAYPSELNLHQRKFLELARALVSDARLVMLDEVLAGLTPSEITSAIAMVRRIHGGERTIVFVEHNMRAVMELTDRLIVLNQGKLIAEGDPRTVMNDPAVVRAYLGTPDVES